MPGDTKIRFTVEGISQLHQSFQDILNDSKSLTEEWTRQGNSIVESLKQQIELLKTRNSFGPGTTTGASQASTSRNESLDSLQGILENLQQDGFLIHKDSLKSLSEMIKNSTNSNDGSKKTDKDKSKSQQSDEDKEDKFSKLLRSFALTSLLKPVQSKDLAEGLIGVGENLGTSLMTMGGKAGWVGLGLSAVMSIIGAKYNAVSSIAPTTSEAAQTLGGSWTQYAVRDRTFEKYGISRDEALQRQIELAKLSGRRNVRSLADDALLWEKTTSLSRSDIASFVRSGRSDRQFDLSTSLSNLILDLKRSGVSNEKIQTQMSEYLKEIVSLNQKQVEQFGVSNINFSMNLYSMLAKMFPQTAQMSPEFIGKISGSLYSGLTNPSSEQMKALQYQAMAKANPDANWFELKMMMEDPLGLSEGITQDEKMKRRKATQNYLTLQRRAGGDWAGFAELLMDNYGLSANVAGTLAKSKNFDFEKLFQEIEANQKRSPQQVEAKLRERLADSVSSIEKLISQWEGVKLGNSVEGIKTSVDSIRKLLGDENGESLGTNLKKGAETYLDVGGGGGVLTMGVLAKLSKWFSF